MCDAYAAQATRIQYKSDSPAIDTFCVIFAVWSLCFYECPAAINVTLYRFALDTQQFSKKGTRELRKQFAFDGLTFEFQVTRIAKLEHVYVRIQDVP